MLVWLASYPRSGNRFSRALLLDTFGGCRCPTVYETHPIERDASELADEASFAGRPDLLDEARTSSKLVFLKTHEIAHAADPAPALYLVRDGRDCVTSYAHFAHTHESRWREDSFEETAEKIIRRDDHDFGGWSANVRAWTRREAPTAIVRFEELIANPIPTLGGAVSSLGVSLQDAKGEAPTFEQLQKGLPEYFRRGKVGGWRTELPAPLEELFWTLHGGEMLTMGYARSHGSG